jgi:tripartite-type tricarboxylate transporter receptor subunit TctC
MRTRRRFLLGSAAALGWASTAWPRSALGQAIGKPARVLVGFPPGGGADIVARQLAERLRGGYAPAVVVENRAGAGGRIAVEAAKNAEADGSTILVSPNPMITLYPHIYRKLAYDPVRDLVPVTSICSFPLVLVAGPGVPAEVKTARDLVRWAKANPRQASYATSATGSTQHFVGVMFARAADVELTHVGYKGGGQAMPDLLGGQLPLMIGTPPSIMASLQAGKLRALAVTGTQRSPLLPEVPTFGELGYAGLDMKDWFGVYLPSKTSNETVARLNAAVREAIRSKEMAEALTKVAVEGGGESPAECASLIAAESRMWAAIVKASGFVGED